MPSTRKKLYMPPEATGAVTPGTAFSAAAVLSRSRRNSAATSVMKASPSSAAAAPARWMKTGAQEVLYSTILASPCISAGGATSQPSRQPVIAQDFEKLL